MDKLYINLELKANRFRQENGLSLTEAIRLKSVLHKNRILTVFLPLSSSFSGMAVKIYKEKEAKRFMLINSNMTIGRQHFTICHELYHLYFQENFTSEKTGSIPFNKSGDPEEYNADVFASYLLIPTHGLLQLIPDAERRKNKISLSTILSVEQYFSCSRSALLYRLWRMELLDKDRFDHFSADKIKNALLHGYSVDLYQPGNNGVVIGDYGSLARELYEKGIVSESSYFSLLEDIGINLSDFDHRVDNE